MTDAQQKALRLLGLARRARLLQIGEEPVGIACRSGKAKLLLVAKDAGDHTFRRARSFTQNGKPPMLRAPFTKEELGGALGCSACAMAAFTDVALALAFVQALDEPEHYAQLIQTLQTQVERVKKRRAEEKAHQKNVRQGKKKPSKV